MLCEINVLFAVGSVELIAPMAVPKISVHTTRSNPIISPWIRSAQSTIHGSGVYARVAIPDGTRIIEYIGERITKAEAKRREDQRLERQRQGGDDCVYIFDLNRRYDLDGRTSRNIARLINHSCAPNCRSETTRGHVWIKAIRDIPAGAELTFDYGYAYDQWRHHPCRCGAKNCAGFIVNAAQRWRVRRIVRAEMRAARAAQRKNAAGESSRVTPRA
jgi:hypothetical protein